MYVNIPYMDSMGLVWWYDKSQHLYIQTTNFGKVLMFRAVSSNISATKALIAVSFVHLWITDSGKRITVDCQGLVILLMEEILHHLGCRNPVNNGIHYLSTGAGFLPSAVCSPLNMTKNNSLLPSFQSPTSCCLKHPKSWHVANPDSWWFRHPANTTVDFGSFSHHVSWKSKGPTENATFPPGNKTILTWQPLGPLLKVKLLVGYI